MGSFRQSTVFAVVRLLVAISLAGHGVFVMANASGSWGAVPDLLLAFTCIVIAGILVAPTIASLLAEPWCIFYYRKQVLRDDELEELIVEYRQRWFERLPFAEPLIPEGRSNTEQEMSDLLDDYCERIRVAVDDLQSEEMGMLILDEALLVFKKMDQQIALREAFVRARRAVNERNTAHV